MFWKTGVQPGLSRSWASRGGGPRADLHMPRPRVAVCELVTNCSSKRSPPRRPATIRVRSAVVQATVPEIRGCPAKDPKRSHTGASSACVSSSCQSEGLISTERPSRWHKTIVPVSPPVPARPLKGTNALVTPRRSSSAHASSRTNSRLPRRRRAVCGLEAVRPDGVRHGSSGNARQVGQDR